MTEACVTFTSLLFSRPTVRYSTSMMLLRTLLVALMCRVTNVLAITSCFGENGQPVDWFIVYKLPDLSDTPFTFVSDGVGYMYMDAGSYQLNLSSKAINDTTSSVGYTLQQIYKRSADIAFLMYNDEDPNGREPSSRGHTKGDIAFDEDSGFWLIHSAPQFPPFANQAYYYPHSATRYGQSFLCVTFNFTSFNDIGRQLLFNNPNIYDSGGSRSLIEKLPNIRKLVDGVHVRLDSDFSISKLQSLRDVEYTSFAKSALFGADLYHELVAPYFKEDMLAETWQNGVGKLPSNCSMPSVENIQDLKFTNLIYFRETKDHSKWAISKYSDSNIVCIGDINRMETQFKRGGGTLCIRNSKIWKVFNAAVSQIDDCSS